MYINCNVYTHDLTYTYQNITYAIVLYIMYVKLIYIQSYFLLGKDRRKCCCRFTNMITYKNNTKLHLYKILEYKLNLVRPHLGYAVQA